MRRGRRRDGLTRRHVGLPDVSLRWILVHLVEETARNLGHIDLLREQADGGIGEEPTTEQTSSQRFASRDGPGCHGRRCRLRTGEGAANLSGSRR